jgi:hypothetical protein
MLHIYKMVRKHQTRRNLFRKGTRRSGGSKGWFDSPLVKRYLRYHFGGDQDSDPTGSFLLQLVQASGINPGISDETKALLSHEMTPEKVKNWQKALVFASQYGNGSIVEALLEKKVPIVLNGSQNPIEQAIGYGHLPVVKLLTSQTYFPFDGIKYVYPNLPPLHYAIMKENYVSGAYLISILKENEINKPYHFLPPITYLHTASKNGDVQFVEMLLDAGANPNDTSAYGSSPLDYAIEFGNNEVIEILLNAGTVVTEKTVLILSRQAPDWEDIAKRYFAYADKKAKQRLYDAIQHREYVDPELKILFAEQIQQARNVPDSAKTLNITSLSQLSSKIPKHIQALVIAPIHLTRLPSLPSGLVYLECSGNPIGTLPRLPEELQTLKCANCSLTSLPELPEELKYLDVRNNKLYDIPKLPNSLTLVPKKMGNNANTTMRTVLLEGNPLPLGLLNGIGPIGTYSKKRIHRTISFYGTDISTMILPKGTLLFRNVDEYKEEEKKGIFINGRHYMYPQMNVFFYPYPFVGENYGTRFLVFELLMDVEVVMAVLPSEQKRSDRFQDVKNTKKASQFNWYKAELNQTNPDRKYYTKTCDKIADPGIQGKPFDGCFTNEFLAEYPEMSGYLGIASLDVRGFLKSDAQERYFTKYRSLFQDYNELKNDKNAYINLNGDDGVNVGVNVGVPEIVLHPLKNRLDNTSQHIYKLIHEVEEEDPYMFQEAWELVERSLGKNGPWTIDLATRMYVNYASASPEVKSRCVPPEDPYKLHWLNNNYDL